MAKKKKEKIKSRIEVILSFVSKKIPGIPWIEMKKDAGMWVFKIGEHKTLLVSTNSEVGKILENEVATVEDVEKVVGFVLKEEGLKILGDHINKFLE